MKSLRKTKIQSAYQLTPDDMPYLFNRTSENGKMAQAKLAYGKFSEIAGNGVRHVYDVAGNHLGVIVKLSKEQGGGYKAIRTRDGKIRVKPKLEMAFKTIRRSN